MIEINKNTLVIGHAHTLDDVRSNNTPGADGIVDVKSSGVNYLSIQIISCS